MVSPPGILRERTGYSIGTTLYHYTALDTFLSIANSKVLRASNVHYLNDAKESELGLERLRQVTDDARSTAEGAERAFLTFFSDWLTLKLLDEYSVYILCFSEARDQLSQWRGYTPHGRGVCLGFSTAKLVSQMQAAGWTFQNCRYQAANQLVWAKSIVERMLSEVREAAPMEKGPSQVQFFSGVLSRTASELLQVAATIKHESFKEEREVRFISPMIENGASEVRFRVARTSLVPYIEFPLVANSAEHLGLDEVLIGPSPSQALTQAALAGFLQQQRIRVGVLGISGTPYREL